VSALPPVVVIGGQTASGKSALALELATRHDGELVCADSRQVYAGMQIASAGPDDDERARVPHHLYGVVDPAGEPMSAGAFVDAADRVISDIVGRGRRAFVVGGTGLYLRALRLGLDDAPPGDPAIKARLLDELTRDGLAPLVERLRARDAAAAETLDLHNPVRVVRALEILEAGFSLAGRDMNALLSRPPRPVVADAAWLLAAPPTAEVDTRIETRARRMFAAGLVDEAVALARRLPADHALLRTMGIEEALDVAAGRRGVDDAVAAVALRTRQYARRQRTWFKREPWWTPASR